MRPTPFFARVPVRWTWLLSAVVALVCIVTATLALTSAVLPYHGWSSGGTARSDGRLLLAPVDSPPRPVRTAASDDALFRSLPASLPALVRQPAEAAAARRGAGHRSKPPGVPAKRRRRASAGARPQASPAPAGAAPAPAVAATTTPAASAPSSSGRGSDSDSALHAKDDDADAHTTAAGDDRRTASAAPARGRDDEPEPRRGRGSAAETRSGRSHGRGDHAARPHVGAPGQTAPPAPAPPAAATDDASKQHDRSGRHGSGHDD